MRVELGCMHAHCEGAESRKIHALLEIEVRAGLLFANLSHFEFIKHFLDPSGYFINFKQIHIVTS